ncbi:MAG: hypothetical protein U0T73_02540 [Chitinophagales bacterium]
MPIKDFYVNHEEAIDANRDFHLLRGNALNLAPLIKVQQQDNTWVDLNAYVPPGGEVVNVAYGATFKVASTVGTVITSTEGHTLDTSTGAITTVAGAAAPNLSNFVVSIILTGNGVLNNKLIGGVRIFLHNSLTKAWLSPPVLTVRRGMTGVDSANTNARFSVYVEFDDGEVADVTHLKLATWRAHSNLVTSSGVVTPEIKVNSGDTANRLVATTIKADVRFGASNLLAEGQIYVDAPWNSTSTFRATSLRTATNVAYNRRNDVPNVLFLADGFQNQPDDIAAFNNAVDELLNRLSGDAILFPYNRFTDSMNFWKCMTFSRQRGLNFLGEVYRDHTVAADANGDVLGFEFHNTNMRIADTAVPVPAAGWTVEDMLYVAGMPTSNLPPLTDPPTPAELTAFRAAITALYSVSDADLQLVTNDVLVQWRNFLVNRIQPNERDTFLNTYWGRKPRAAFPKFMYDSRMMDLHNHRTSRSGLNQFLSRLRTPTGQSLNNIWNESATEPRPKDFDLIVFVLNSEGGRELNGDGYFFLNLHDPTDIYDMVGYAYRHKFLIHTDAANPSGRAYNLSDFSTVPITTSVPAVFNNDQYGVFSHELSHSFGLDDEYQEESYKDLDYPADVAEETKRFWSNVQPHAFIEDPATHNISNTDGIKWNWDRIRIAGLTSAVGNYAPGANPTIPGTVTLPMKAGHAARFAVGQKVKLRQRIPRLFKTELMTITAINGNVFTVTTINSSHLSPNIFKWFGKGNWAARIDPASGVVNAYMVLDGPVTGNGPTYDMPLTASGATFVVGNRFRLIANNQTFLTENNFVSETMTIQSIAGNTITLVEDVAGTLPYYILLDFMAGSLLYLPMEVPAADATPTYKFYKLAWKEILSEMKTQAQALNGTFASVAATVPALPLIGLQDPLPLFDPKFRLAVRNSPDMKRKAVGLYTGGDQYTKGVYHPTGFCKMRSSQAIGELCAVCRYAVIDLIDPGLHKENDDLIQDSYPVDVVLPNP